MEINYNFLESGRKPYAVLIFVSRRQLRVATDGPLLALNSKSGGFFKTSWNIALGTRFRPRLPGEEATLNPISVRPPIRLSRGPPCDRRPIALVKSLSFPRQAKA
jgi:hypothetical protein